MKEKIDSINLANKSKEAQNKIETGQGELSGVQETVNENLDILAHEASMDYLAKLKRDLMKAVDTDNTKEAEGILQNISFHKKSMQEFYDSKARENPGSYFDGSTKEVDMEKFKKEMDSFMAETLLMWYGKDDAKKAKISGETANLSELDFDELMKVDEKKYGKYTINPETAGLNFEEKEPEIKILDMKEFIGKSKQEVMKAVIEKYGEKYNIPGLEYEKYLLENPDKVPEKLKEDGNRYYFMGSVLRSQGGYSSAPCVYWTGGKLFRDANWLLSRWREDARVLLLEK